MATQDNTYFNVPSTSNDELSPLANHYHIQPWLSASHSTENIADPRDQAGPTNDTVGPIRYTERHLGSSSAPYDISRRRQSRHPQVRRDERFPATNIIQIPAYDPIQTDPTISSIEEWHQTIQLQTGSARATRTNAIAGGDELSSSLTPQTPIDTANYGFATSLGPLNSHQTELQSLSGARHWHSPTGGLAPPLQGYPIPRPQVPYDAQLWPQPTDAFLYPTLDYGCYCRCIIGECRMLRWATRIPQREVEQDGLDAEQVISECNERQPKEIHLRKPSSTSGMEARWLNLIASLPAIDEIPGSLKLLVVKGGRSFYDELLRQVKDRGIPLEYAIRNALQHCDLAICDAFSKQLKADSNAIEEWKMRQQEQDSGVTRTS